MISKELIYNSVLPLVKEKTRMLDYYLIQSLFENRDKEIMEELKKYQNIDGGFGHGLEPDVQMPQSNIASTDIAIFALDFVKDPTLKEEMIEQIVHYYEDSYNEEIKRFVIVPKEVDNYPHAVWWNYDQIGSFEFGNPDPEVIGFLYKYRKYMRKLNYSKLINDVVDFVISDKFLDAGMHTLLSVLRFYKDVDNDVKNLIHDRLHLLVNKELDNSYGKWNEYGLEPYKVYILEPHFLNTRLTSLGENLTVLIEQIKNLSVEPNWKWYQYDDVFETVKYQWVGHIYFNMIYALRLHHII